MTSSPGTVSKILWHFTGGPQWNEAEKRQADNPKPASEAYNALLSILKDHKLRIGGYKEIIKVKVPAIGTYEEDADTWFKERDATQELISAPVCCLADIPIIHLGYHADRYGKFAIGFTVARPSRTDSTPYSNNSMIPKFCCRSMQELPISGMPIRILKRGEWMMCDIF